jgi:hypothetical protein
MQTKLTVHSIVRAALAIPAIALPALQLLGCFPGPFGGPGPASPGYSAAAMPAPPPAAPLTEAQWAELEARGAAMAQGAGTTNHFATERLQAQGFVVERTLQLTGGWCYAAAITWIGQSQAHATIMWEAGPDGRRVNEQLGGAQERLSPPGGLLRFCADNSGPANLSISSITPSGTIDNNARLEFSVVLGGSQEAPEAALARRQTEAVQGAEAQARIDQNIANAEARDRANQEQRCRDCRDDLVRCREARAVGADYHSRTITTASTCEGQFRECSFPSFTDASRAPDEWPCGRE